MKFVLVAIVTLQVLDGTLAACADNAVNYTGDYARAFSVNLNYADDKLNAIKGESSSIRILPAEGGTSSSYVIQKFLDKNSNLVSQNAQAAAESATNRLSNITTLCVAAPYSDEGLECVDIDDAGITKLRPVRVDEDCNLIHGWMTYLEPKTPGCPPNDNNCAPSVVEGPVTREGYSAEEGTLLKSSAGSSRNLTVATLLVLLGSMLRVM